MVRPIKKKQIPNLQETIKTTAWKQIAKEGASALSLRAIARELKITAPAIYNYFPSRDDLVTALIVDAYASLGEAQEASVANLSPDNHIARLTALGLAYRDWAVTYPQRYQLIFGTPIPGYVAPEEVTLPVAAKALVPLLSSIQAAYSASRLRLERLPKLTAELKSMLIDWKNFGGGADIEVLYLTLVIWSRVHGLVMLEIGNHMPSLLTDPGEVFRCEINAVIAQYL